jgi:protein-S-isoprenylcysteine O-methyltransferase Ste14
MGIALESPGVAACVGLPLIAYFHRIRLEEAVLERELGDAYRAYERRTRRLVPGIW